MIAILQRILNASVTSDGKPYSECQKGFLVLLGVGLDDDENDARVLAEKISKLRVFEDENDKMNLSINDVGGELMVVPNFTLLASYKKGNRPAFVKSAPPEVAEKLFDYFCDYSETLVKRVARGCFRTYMQVSLVNDGPITIPMDSKVLLKKGNPEQ